MLIALLAGAVLLGALMLALSWQQSKRAQMRARDLPKTIQQLQPLIRAIERYEQDHGKPPTSTVQLAPKYLQQLPYAGPVAKGGWTYGLSDPKKTGGWTLSVRVRDEYSPNLFMGFGDTFVFQPNGKYPQSAHGGKLLPFGKWGYYVE